MRRIERVDLLVRCIAEAAFEICHDFTKAMDMIANRVVLGNASPTQQAIRSMKSGEAVIASCIYHGGFRVGESLITMKR